MKFICDQCSTKYAIDDARVRGKVLKIRCKACQNLITVRDPALGETPGHAAHPPTESPAAAAAPALPPPPTPPVPPPPPSLAQDQEEHTQVSSLPSALADAMKRRPAAPASPRADWFVSFDGEQEGPHTLEQARSRIRDEVAKGREAFAWKEGFGAWTAVDKVPELKVALRPLVAPPPAKLDFDDSTVAAAPRPALLARARQPETPLPAPVDLSTDPHPKLAFDDLPATAAAPSPLLAEPAPVESAPVEPAPVEPAPVEPAPVEPPPAEHLEVVAPAPIEAEAAPVASASNPAAEDPSAAHAPAEVAAVAAPAVAEASTEEQPAEVESAPVIPAATVEPEAPAVDKVSAISDKSDSADEPPTTRKPVARPAASRKSGAVGKVAPAPFDPIDPIDAAAAEAPTPMMVLEAPPRRGMVYALVACVGVILLLGGVLVWQMLNKDPATVATVTPPTEPPAVRPPPIDDRPVGFVDTTPKTPVVPPPVAPPPVAESAPRHKTGPRPPAPPKPVALTEDQKRLAAMYKDNDKPAQLETLPKVTREEKPKEAVSNNDIMSVVTRGKKSVQMCFERSLKRDGVLKNLRVDVELKIGISGSVTSVNLGDPRIGSTELGTCLKQTIKRWHFPSQDSEYQTAFPLLLQAQ